jgi:hypothetical protein
MSDEKKVMCHTFLVSYLHGRGFGSLINYREIGKETARPSFADLDSMLDKVCKNAAIERKWCLVLSVSELQDEMVPVSQLDSYAEKSEQE